MKVKSLFAVCTVGLTFAVPAMAVPITGGISFSDGFTTLPGVGSTTIVSQLVNIDPQPVAQVFGTSNSFAGILTAAASDFNTGAGNQLFFTTNGTVFTFTGTVGAVIRSAVTCVPVVGQPLSQLCSDSLTLGLNGTVTGPAGFDPSQFSGNWTGNGSCTANLAGQCQSTITASWSSSLVATGTPPQVPEPASLALVGIALAGLGFARRKNA